MKLSQGEGGGGGLMNATLPEAVVVELVVAGQSDETSPAN